MITPLLRQFLLVHRHRSLGRAAAALGLSQPALSKAMRRLEAAVGAPLFERTAAGVAPTPAGDALAGRAAVIAAEFEHARAEIAELREARGGLLRVGVLPVLAPEFLPRAIEEFLRELPGARIVAHEGLYPVLAERLRAGSLDMAFCTRPWAGLPSGLIATPLLRDEFVVAAGPGHPLLGQRGVSGRALRQWPWVAPPRTGILWPRLLEMFLRADEPLPPTPLETDSIALARAMLAGGRFLTILPRRLLGDTLFAVDAPGFTLPREVVALFRENAAPSALAERFLNLLR